MHQFALKILFFLLLVVELSGQPITRLEVDSLLVEMELAVDSGSFSQVFDHFSTEVKESISEMGWAERYAQILTFEGSALRHLEQYDSSLLTHSEALEIRKYFCGESSIESANSYLNLGNVYFELNQLDAARQSLETARKIHEVLPFNHAIEFAAVLNSIGQIDLVEHNWSQAQAKFLQAYTLMEPFGVKSPQLMTPYTLSLSNCYVANGQLLKARSLLQEHLNTLRISKVRHNRLLANLYNNLSTVETKLMLFDTALIHQDSALHFYNQLNQFSQQDYGNCLQNKGLILMENGDLSTATSHFQAAVTYLQHYPLDLGVALQNLGLSLLHQNDLEEAENSFIAAIEALRAENIELDSPELASIYLNLGSCYLLKGEESLPYALYYLEEAGRIFARFKDQSGYLKSLNLQAKGYITLGNVNKAKDLLQRVTRKSSGKLPNIYCASLYYQAELAGLKKDYVSARHLLLKALEYSSENDLHFQAKIYNQLAALSFRTKSWVNCLRNAKLGINLLNSLKSRISQNASLTNLNQEFYQLYDFALEACFELQMEDAAYKSLAFSLSERFKSQVLDQYFGKRSLNKDSLMVLNQALAKINTKLYLGEQQNLLVSPEKSALQRSKLQLEQRLETLKEHDTGLEYSPIEPSVFQSHIGQRESALIYHWGERSLFVFVMDAEQFHFFKVEDIEDLFEHLNRLFYWNTQRIEQKAIPLQQAIYDTLVSESHFLYQKLIEPFESLLLEKLYIVPDGPLALLPFDGLIKQPANENRLFRNHHYLLLDYPIAYLYPASEITFWQAAPENNRKVLAVAPEFSWELSGLEPLRYNINEARQLGQIVQTELQLNDQATELNFKRKAQDFSILHLSTHGILNHRRPDFSYIAFKHQEDSVENEYLYVAEIEALDLKADLVVLSACQSAIGRLYRGEGLLSIARAFRIAGAKSLVSALWNVDDHQTPEMMQVFYEFLASGYSKSEALREAKIHYIQSSTHFEATPFYWAGFVFYGNDTPLKLKKRIRFWPFL